MDEPDFPDTSSELAKQLAGVDGVISIAGILTAFRVALEDSGWERDEAVGLCQCWLEILGEALGVSEE